jgi:hypothetical protein
MIGGDDALNSGAWAASALAGGAFTSAIVGIAVPPCQTRPP